MNKEEYLKLVTEQMRCEKARKMVADEMEGHIDDQAEAYVEMGMHSDRAMERAVAEMGDPVETGVMLDHTHRPKMAWEMIALIAVISVVGLLVQYVISSGNAEYGYDPVVRQAVSVVVGFFVMIGIYFLDYSTIGKCARPAGAVFLLFMFVNIFFTGTMVNGAVGYMKIGSVHVSLTMLMYLYVPIYGAVLYSYRGGGYKALEKSFLWMILPSLLSVRIPALNLAVSLFAVMFIMLTIAVVKNWFRVNKKAVLCVSWGAVVLMPAAFIIAALGDLLPFLAEYQTMRLKAWVNPGIYDQGYQITKFREMMETSRLIGRNQEGLNVAKDWWQATNTDYILMHMTAYYGLLAAAVLVALLAWLILKIFKISVTQKNQMGMMMGCGCGLVFGVQTVMYVLQNYGIMPPSSVFLPLFSYGATGTVVSYILLGILLSIYRYQNIIPAEIKSGKKVEITAIKN